MKDISTVFGDVVLTTAYYKRSEDSDLKSTDKAQNDHLETADLETTLTKAGFGKYNLLTMLIAIPVAISSGMVSGAVSMVLHAIGCDLQCTRLQKGILQVAPYVGMISSGFFWGSASDSFGRRKLITYGFIFDGIAGVLSALSPSVWLMAIFKLISGAMNCGPYSIFMTFLAESFNLKYRDYAVLSMGLFSAIGNVLQPSLGLLITWYIPIDPITIYGGFTLTAWRLYLVVSAVPSLMCGLGSLLLFESPKFLLQSGKIEEALEVCKGIYSWNTGLPRSTFPVHNIIDPNSHPNTNTEEGNTKKLFFKRVMSALSLSMRLFKKPFVGRALMFFAIQFGTISAMNALRLWLPQIFAMVDNTNPNNVTASYRLCDILEKSSDSSGTKNCETASPTSFVNMIIVNSLMFVAQAVFITSVKYLGRKVPVVLCTFIPALSVAGIAFVDIKYVVYLAAVFTSFLNVSFFAVAFLVTDTFPTSLRATSVNATQLCGRIGVLVTQPFLSVFMFTHCHIIIPGLSVLLFMISFIAMMLPMTPLSVPIKAIE